MLFTDVSSQGWLREITLFKQNLREKCSLLVRPVLGMGNKMWKTGGASQTVARFFIQMKGVLPMASGVIIID